MDRLFSILLPLIPISIFVVAILHLFGLIDVWEAVDRVFDGNPSVTEIDTTATPTIFSNEQASAFLLGPDDFPNRWEVQKSNLSLDAKHLDFMVAKRINY